MTSTNIYHTDDSPKLFLTMNRAVLVLIFALRLLEASVSAINCTTGQHGTIGFVSTGSKNHCNCTDFPLGGINVGELLDIIPMVLYPTEPSALLEKDQLCLIQEDTNCSSNWIAFQNTCFYLNHTARVKYPEAERECINKGASLAIVHNEEENEFLTDLLRDDTTRDYHGYFIGLTDIVTESEFVWADGTQLNYTNWAPKSPNNQNDQDCVCMTAHNGKWNDCSCNVRYAYICRKT